MANSNSESIPQKQLAGIYEKHGGTVSLKEIPVPQIGDDDVLVKILYTGVCHTDIHVWQGDLPVNYKEFPLVGGHEGAGVVVKVGKNVTNFKIGDRAGVQWINSTCLKCEFCTKGLTASCPNALLSGCTRDGSFEQYAAVKSSNAAHIPNDVDIIKVAPILCAGVTVFTALRDSGIRPKEIIAITGAGGGLGSLCIQYARAMDLRVLAIDMGEKEKHCRDLGAEFFVDPAKSKNIVEEVRKLTDGGPHAVINLATAEKPMDQACQYVRTRGSVVLVALPKDAKVMSGNAKDTEEALGYFSKGHISIPIEVQPLSALPEVFKRVREGKVSGRVVLDMWK
ncbi:alcohol dehydrogenase [Aphelenchoides bicaudatus]|nr:alcohol dehydrogenase [Aphelenchoides bicaudatus]